MQDDYGKCSTQIGYDRKLRKKKKKLTNDTSQTVNSNAIGSLIGMWIPKAAPSPLVQDVHFLSADGTRLHAWWLPRPGAAGAVLYFHGNGGNLSWWGDALGASLLMPEQMRSMEGAGIEFGSHCVNHRPLTSLSHSELVEELTRSREVLASIVAHPLPVLAYPFGDVDERVKRAAQRAGYSAALAVNSGPLELRSDLYEIRRLLVANRSHEAYMKMKLSGAEKLYRWLKWKAGNGLRSYRRSLTRAATPAT